MSISVSLPARLFRTLTPFIWPSDNFGILSCIHITLQPDHVILAATDGQILGVTRHDLETPLETTRPEFSICLAHFNRLLPRKGDVIQGVELTLTTTHCTVSSSFGAITFPFESISPPNWRGALPDPSEAKPIRTIGINTSLLMRIRKGALAAGLTSDFQWFFSGDFGPIYCASTQPYFAAAIMPLRLTIPAQVNPSRSVLLSTAGTRITP